MEIKINDFLEHFPFIRAISRYNNKKFKNDLIAGATVAIMALPQAMAYAIIAGIHPKYGIYAAIVPVIINSLFSSSKHLISGPTNATSMAIYSILSSTTLVAGTLAINLPEEQKIALIFLLAAIKGVLQIIMSLFKLGDLIRFVSVAVITGFTTGAGFLIAFGQMKNLLGINIGQHTDFLEVVYFTVINISHTHLLSLLLGLFTILFIILIKIIDVRIPGQLLAIVISAMLVYFLNLDFLGVKLIGEVPSTLALFSSFPISLDLIRTLIVPATALAILGIIEAVSTAKLIASFTGDKVDGNQELLAQGLSNLFAAFFSGIPGGGSLSRTMVSYGAGAKTCFTGIFSAIIILFIVAFLAPFTKYIPVASLAGMLMIVAYYMIDIPTIKTVFKATSSDRMVLIATFIATLIFQLDKAVYVGVILSLLFFLKKVSVPLITRLTPDYSSKRFIPAGINTLSCNKLEIIDVEGSLFFGSIHHLEDAIRDLRILKKRIVVIRMKHVHAIDVSGVLALKNLIKKRDEYLDHYCIFSCVKPNVMKVLRKTGLTDLIGTENIVPLTNDGVKLAIEKHLAHTSCEKCKLKDNCPIKPFD